MRNHKKKCVRASDIARAQNQKKTHTQNKTKNIKTKTKLKWYENSKI